ncbi:uncharacterized protein METZ01_LOCUS196918, partial [marine metagenome]
VFYRKWQKGDISRSFDGDRQTPLVLGAISRNPGGNYFPSFGNQGFQSLYIKKIDEFDFFRAKPADFLGKKASLF